MSDSTPKKKKSSTPGKQIRVRIDKLRQARQRSVLGPAEIVALGSSALLLLAVIFAYFYFLTPAQSRLKRLQNERASLKGQLSVLQEGVKLNADTESTVANISASLERFENGGLAERSEGRIALYNELNHLIRSNNLRNTAGPAYVSLDPLGTRTPGQNAPAKPGNAKWQSVYPGIGINLTVEGQYQNLRHFLHDIEKSRQFLVINAVELESVTDSNEERIMNLPAPGPSPTTGPAPRATHVSLRLNMAAYFRRGTTADIALPPPTEIR